MKNRKRRKRGVPFAFIFLLVFCVCMIFFLAISELSNSTQSKGTTTIDDSKEQFIAELTPHARELQTKYGVKPSIILGQAVLESDWGRSDLSAKYHNLFGVKAETTQAGVNLQTKEYQDGKWVEISARFRVYPSYEASMDEHTLLFVNGTSWNPTQYQSVVTAKNYQEAAQALQKTGYATDPTYATKIIEVIEQYDLAKYDK